MLREIFSQCNILFYIILIFIRNLKFCSYFFWLVLEILFFNQKFENKKILLIIPTDIKAQINILVI